MPCMQCSNGKYKYGVHGNCQFDTLEQCHEAEQAIHARETAKEYGHPTACQCPGCVGYQTGTYSQELDSSTHYN